MSEIPNNCHDIEAGLQPALQPSADIPARLEGTDLDTEPDRAVPSCKCGAGPHPTRLDICAKGHALPGNQRARKHDAPTREERSDDEISGIEPEDYIHQALALAGRQVATQRRILDGALTARQ